tara:strand:- start:6017 stop:6196 length:180 start_codon:yes stop_codon:yes gene_type:complete
LPLSVKIGLCALLLVIIANSFFNALTFRHGVAETSTYAAVGAICVFGLVALGFSILGAY